MQNYVASHMHTNNMAHIIKVGYSSSYLPVSSVYVNQVRQKCED